jgi:hypothetical protein
MALNPHVPRPRDWDAEALTRQVRASAGLRLDHLAAAHGRARSCGTCEADQADEADELDAVRRYLARFAHAGATGVAIPWSDVPAWAARPGTTVRDR